MENLDKQKSNILVEPVVETVEEPVAETDEEPLGEPEKPSLLKRLKEKRWTFKLKNNFTEYVTVEPLICFYMLQIFVVSLIEPYRFHKVFLIIFPTLRCDDNLENNFLCFFFQACLSLDQDAYFCNVITINENHIYQPCATFEYNKIQCKGLSRIPEQIICDDVIERYERNLTKVFVKPEDYRFCKVIEKAAGKLDLNTDSLVGISGML